MGSLFGGGQEDQAEALKAATQGYQNYRPDAYQAQMNALANASSAYQGANNALETLWGAKPSKQQVGFPQLSAMPKSPMAMGPPPNWQPAVQQPQSSSDDVPGIVRLFDPAGIFF